MPRHVRALAFFASTLLLAACARPGTLSTSGPFDIQHAPDDGLRYFLARDLLTVDAKVSTFRESVRGRFGACEPRDSLATTWTLAVTTVPDRRAAYRLGLVPSGSVEQTLGVKVDETGMLTGLNYAGSDERAAIATTIVKGAAGVIGFVARTGIAASRDTTCAAPKTAKTPFAVKHIVRTFDLTELPAVSDAPASLATMNQHYAAFPRALELYALANILISVSSLPEPAGTIDATADPLKARVGCAGSDTVCAHIYYREPIMRVIRVHVPDNIGAAPTQFTVSDEKLEPLVSASDPILHLSFGTQTLGAGKISLSFGKHGNVTGIEQSSSAAIAGTATAAAAAADGARDAYLAALRARVDQLDLELKAAKDNAALQKAADTSSTPK